MHEFSLARNIVSIASEAVRKSHAHHATEIQLEIGECSGVEVQAFEFAWPFVVKGTVLEKARKEIIQTPGLAKCQECGQEFHMHRFYDPCPRCGSFLSTIQKGNAFKVRSLHVI